MQNPETKIHFVARGERLLEIATRYGTTVEAVWALPENAGLQSRLTLRPIIRSASADS